jgi:hypothetical protein
MASPYGKILTDVGLIGANGKISNAARQRYVADVSLLLINGNHKGKTLFPISEIIAMPPIPGPIVPSLNPLISKPENFFWFNPDPILALGTIALLNKNHETDFWHQIFIDFLFEKSALMLDLPGSTPFFPIFDASGPFGVELPLPFTLPDLAAELKILPPELAIKLAKLGIKVALPSLPTLPEIPTLPIPLGFPGGIPLPFIALPPFPMLPELLLGLIKLPVTLIGSLITDISLAFDIPGLPKKIFDLAFKALLLLLDGLGLLNLLPKTFIASIIVYMKNVIAMVCVVIIGLLIGSGSITKSLAIMLGLILPA